MKALKYIIPLKKILFGFLALGLAFSLTSCAQKLTFLNSKVVPAAQGTVKVKQDSNKNYDIKIDISNLAEPERLQPPKKDLHSLDANRSGNDEKYRANKNFK